jgi:hypothetical protein
MVIVEIDAGGHPFDLTLDFDFDGGRTSSGSWSCPPGRLRLSGGFFECRWGVTHLWDRDIGMGDVVKWVFNVDRERKSAGFLFGFGKWLDLVNGATGRTDLWLPDGSVSSPWGKWRIKRGAPFSRLGSVLPRPS